MPDEADDWYPDHDSAALSALRVLNRPDIEPDRPGGYYSWEPTLRSQNRNDLFRGLRELLEHGWIEEHEDDSNGGAYRLTEQGKEGSRRLLDL